MAAAALDTAFTPFAAPASSRPNRLRSTRPALLVVANPHASGIAERSYLPGAVARVLRDYGARVERRLTESPDELAEVVVGEVAGRSSDDDVVLFKSLGIAAEDLAVAKLVVDRASERGLGTTL